MTTSSMVVALLCAVALLLFVGPADSIVCPPGYCQQQQCKPVDEATCNGIVKPNATFCQCCPACIKLLGPCDPVDEASCNGVVKPNATFCECCPACIRVLGKDESCFQLFLRGDPPKVECATGLICDPNTATCVPILSF
ncbi:uncharacterized protein LOC119459580 [Dermacentor silvarum]|uniref:uncharacterized protein LOC119459580 n=1 Tax=Dermacentor silvarum TaxID=543639 RepID=UPI00210090BE|nr:uncharacterized protein LOC119459580 [Dermacentor silvarum]XP_049526825.1 uncharacterized protein LOC119459580 [Dermacentor silvarum]